MLLDYAINPMERIEKRPLDMQVNLDIEQTTCFLSAKLILVSATNAVVPNTKGF